MGPAILEHKVVDLAIPKQEGFGPAVLGHRVDMLVALGHRGFVPSALNWHGSEPVGPRQEDSLPATIGFDLDLVPAKVSLVDTYTRVAAAWVGFSVARIDLAVAKFVPGFAEVGPARVWAAEHIAFAVVWPATTIVRIDLVVVADDLVVVVGDLLRNNLPLMLREKPLPKQGLPLQ